ncbi:hypothetical protein [Plantactinospora sp. B5E13]|uniref:hypothetical protein n=1 Tax=Plantactinospora sp. B5E13 TaxID=3153758 RepID=UPI00325F283F
MNRSAITLRVSGPVPGSESADAAAVAALIRELHARTILHVAHPTAEQPTDVADPTGRKGTTLGTLAELVVTGLFSATTVAALAQVIIAFVQRGAARQITLRDGRRTLTISDPNEETERMVADWLGVPPTRNGVGSGAD